MPMADTLEKLEQLACHGNTALEHFHYPEGAALVPLCENKWPQSSPKFKVAKWRESGPVEALTV